VGASRKIATDPISISNEDGAAILRACARTAKKEPALFALDQSDVRHIGQRTVVRTEACEVEVEVPDRDVEGETEATSAARRMSIKTQALLSQLGAILGFTIWIPASDRTRVLDLLPANYHTKLVATLPLNYDQATLKTIENIDVIWLDRRAIAHAFEVEHTTTIYSGLLRMADLLAMQPRMNISLRIVAPIERRDQVRREIIRPVFSVLEGGAMAERLLVSLV
jgi:hypothetical protein